MAEEFDPLPLAEPLVEAEWWAGAEFAHWVDGARARLKRAAEEALRRAVGDFRRTGEPARVHAAADLYLNALGPGSVPLERLRTGT